MDIDLLAKMVGELMLENDEVGLPGVGTFVAELIPATFSNKGFTINPPYRKLSFRQRESNSDLLVDFYARTNSIDKNTAAEILGDFLSEMKNVLKTRKFIIFPGLGKLRATKENHFFFVPDENLNIYPEGFGLEPVSLKSLEDFTEITELKETKEAVAAIATAEPLADEAAPSEVLPEAVAETTCPAEILPVPPVTPAPAESEPAEEPVPAEEPATVEESVTEAEAASPVEPEPEPAPQPEPEQEPQPEPAPEPAPGEAPASEVPESKPAEKTPKHLGKAAKAILFIVLIAILLLAIFAILGRVAPDFIDKLLYSPEEYKILHP